ncbi:MAG TPA: MinD/ParA family protein [Candidatus Dormibacteraeota bacterium]
MRGVRIPQGLNGEDQFVLGLSVTRLAALLLGLLAAYTILHLSLPAPVQLIGAGLAALIGAAIAWVRPEGRSLIHWMTAAIEYYVATNQGTGPAQVITAVQQAPTVAPAPPRKPKFQVLGNRIHPDDQSSPIDRAQSSEARRVSPNAINFLANEPNDDVIELPDDSPLATPTGSTTQTLQTSTPAPVYLGGTQIITFFSTKGGTGRTTLATEVACLLAMKGAYREAPGGLVQPLRVALVDFDLGSANVSARIGMAQPTLLDFLCDSSVQAPDPLDFLIRHPNTGLDVLLGPSKCLTGDRAELMGVSQAAHVLSSLKGAGYHFVILDIASGLGDLETYLLEAATRVFCVVTPTAGSIQSLYRGVEALRRLGLGSKLSYVANKMRGHLSLDETLSDLNGRLAASVPYDPAFDSAENDHRPLAVQHANAAVRALLQLAASAYPALELPASEPSGFSPLAWLSRRRRAG